MQVRYSREGFQPSLNVERLDVFRDFVTETLEQQIGQMDQELATLLHPHQDAVQRLAEVPGLGVDSAQQVIAEVGPTAATFPSRETAVVVDGRLPRRRRERRRKLQPPISEGQPWS